MSLLNFTRDVGLPLFQQFYNSTIANQTVVAAQDHIIHELTKPRRKATTIAAIVITAFLFSIIIAALLRVSCGKPSKDPDPELAPELAPGHVYGHDNASSIRLAALRSGRGSERPSFQHVEDSAWGGSTVAYPSPALTSGSAWRDQPSPALTSGSAWRDQSSPTPPPPCK